MKTFTVLWLIFLSAFSLSAETPKIQISLVLHGDNLKCWACSKYTDRGIQAPTVKQITLSALIPVNGTTTQITSTKDFVYPTAFSAPKIFHINTTPLVIPICPTKFTSKAVGWTMALSSTMANNLVYLQGTCTYVEPDSSSQNGVYGEKTGPIHTKDINPSSTDDALLSQNAASIPSFETTATPFYLFAKLGKPYIMHLKVGSESVEATMVCTLP